MLAVIGQRFITRFFDISVFSFLAFLVCLLAVVIVVYLINLFCLTQVNFFELSKCVKLKQTKQFLPSLLSGRV